MWTEKSDFLGNCGNIWALCFSPKHTHRLETSGLGKHLREKRVHGSSGSDHSDRKRGSVEKLTPLAGKSKETGILWENSPSRRGGDRTASSSAPAGCTKTSRWTDRSRLNPVWGTADLSGFTTPTLGLEVCAYFSQVVRPRRRVRVPPQKSLERGKKTSTWC